MSAGIGIDSAGLAPLITDSGVKVTSEELDAIARSLARIEAAAANLNLLSSLLFDETAERFNRLLESDKSGGVAG